MVFTTKGLERGMVYGRDLYGPLVRTIDRLYLVWVALTLGLPFLVGYRFGGTWQRGVEAMIWAGLVRIFLFQHITFSINSICHFFGSQPFRTRDESRNVPALAILSLGESWHNGHHAFPASAVLRPRTRPGRHFRPRDPRDGEAPPRLGGQAPRPAADRAAAGGPEARPLTAGGQHQPGGSRSDQDSLSSLPHTRATYGASEASNFAQRSRIEP